MPSSKPSAAIKKWHVPVPEGFTEIDNGDSIQLRNADASRVVYLSVLTAKNEKGEAVDLSNKTEPSAEVVREENYYHLRGTKTRRDEILVVVITFKDRSDEIWARDFLSKIT
jgi:hypothetical protein